MSNRLEPFIDTLKGIADRVLIHVSRWISDPRLKISAETYLQFVLANELLDLEPSSSKARFLGLEIGCIMTSDLPDTRKGGYKVKGSIRDRRSKWVDVLMSSSDWKTWLWLELKAPQKGGPKIYKKFMFYDIIGREIGDTRFNDIHVEPTIQLFDGFSGESMGHNCDLLEWDTFKRHYLEVEHHVKAGLLYWDDRNQHASAALQTVDKYGLAYTDLATRGMHRLSIIHPS
jgi:hypothetical protein